MASARRLAVLAGMVLLLSSCGGGDDSGDSTEAASPTESSSAPLSKTAFIEQADAFCSRTHDAQEQIEDDFERAVRRGDFEEAAGLMEDLISGPFQAAFDGLSELEPPVEERPATDRYLEATNQQIIVLQRLVGAVRDEDEDSMSALGKELDTINTEADGIAAELGFKVCGQN